MMSHLFADRVDAGLRLACALDRYKGPTTLVLGLPRGGVVVAAEVARSLGSELNVIITRKLGAPGNAEYAVGAIAEGGELALNEQEIDAIGISDAYLRRETDAQEQEIQRRIDFFRHGLALPPMKDRPVVVVDDGVATGFTMLAALRRVGHLGAHPVVMATPVIPPSSLDLLARECDDTVVLATPDPFYAVGLFYEDFEQVTDQEVLQALRSAQVTHVA